MRLFKVYIETAVSSYASTKAKGMNDAGWFRKREISDVAIHLTKYVWLVVAETSGTTNTIYLVDL